MEEKTKNSGLIIALISFIVISLGLGGYICFDKFVNNKDDNTNITKTENHENTSIVEQNDRNDYYQVLELSPVGGLAVVYNGEVYVNVYDSTPNIDRIYGDGKYQTLVKTRNSYQEYNFGDLKVSMPLNDFGTDKWLKLNVSGVKEIYNNEYGQALSNMNPKYGIILVNSDETVSFINLSEVIDGNTNPIKLDISNIVSIKTENNDGYTTYLIKSDGTKIDVNTLIK